MVEVFGDNQTTTCGSPWYDVCEADWASNSDNGSLDICEYNTDTGVGVKAGTLPNGAGRAVTLGATVKTVRATATAEMIAGAANVATRLVFKDSSGTTLHTAQNVESVNEVDEYVLGLQASKPSAAVAVEVQFAVVGDVGDVAWFTDVLVESVGEPPDPPSDQTECDLEALNQTDDARTDCTTGGGSFSGDCEGWFNDGFCHVNCDWVCYGAGGDITFGDAACTQGWEI